MRYVRKECDYCHTDPEHKENGLWNGFRDAATRHLVCWRCRERHYKAKELRTTGVKELPVREQGEQLTLF